MSELLVLGAGPPNRDGGVDLFLELVAAISAAGPAHFMWAGRRGRVTARRLDDQVEQLGADVDVVWADALAPPVGHVRAVMVLTARTVAAATEALTARPSAVPLLGLYSDDDVARLVTGALDASSDADPIREIVPYPDIRLLARRATEVARVRAHPATGPQLHAPRGPTPPVSG